VQAGRAELRPHCGHGLREGLHDAALGRQHFGTFCIGKKLHVLGQHTVLVLGAGVSLHEALNQRAQVVLGWKLQGRHLGLQRCQARHVRACDLCQQVMLVAHIVVQQRLAHATSCCHLVHRGCGVAAGGENVRSRRQNLRALVIEAG